MDNLINASVRVSGNDISLVHVRYDGRSHDVYVSNLQLGDETTQQQLFSAVENNLDLTVGSLTGYELDYLSAEHRTAAIRPAAKFGC